MKIFIPIKHNSQRVPEKNFRQFQGKTLYKHTLVKLSNFQVYVDTDSNQILEQIRTDDDLSHVCGYKRSGHLLGHTTSVCELITDFINRYEIQNETLCQVHVTSPFLCTDTLVQAREYMRGGDDSVVSCNTLQTRLWRKEQYGMCPINHNPMKLEQTQDLPLYYEENSLFYIFNSNNILNTGSRVGQNPYFYNVSFPENLDIDTEQDWSLIKKLEEYA